MFENLSHDFPQRIIYRRTADASVTARIEGTVKGEARGRDFPYTRCAQLSDTCRAEPWRPTYCACYDPPRRALRRIATVGRPRSRHLSAIWELEAGDDALAEPIFPDGRVEIVVHLGARPRRRRRRSWPQPEVMVVGQMTAALRLQPTAQACMPSGSASPQQARRTWLGAPLHECTDAIHGLERDRQPRGGRPFAMRCIEAALCSRR